MKVTCYGPRGSLPAPSRKGFSTVEFGGNTNCFFIEAGPFKVLVGCGSGAATLGDALMEKWLADGNPAENFIVLLTHYHWDHIQGLPFCAPFYLGSNTVHFHGLRPSGLEGGGGGEHPKTVVEMMLSHQQSNPHFPVAHESLPAKKEYHSHDRQFSETFHYCSRLRGAVEHSTHWPQSAGMHCSSVERNELVGPEGRFKGKAVLKVVTVPLQHPNGCLGWVIEYMGKKVAFCYDMEPLRFPNQKMSKLAKGADLLVLDGAYTEEQLQGDQQGFGHGSPESCVEQAQDTGADFCLIHHHDPKHDDAKLREMEARAQDYAGQAGFKGRVEFAREGNVYDLGK